MNLKNFVKLIKNAFMGRRKKNQAAVNSTSADVIHGSQLYGNAVRNTRKNDEWPEEKDTFANSVRSNAWGYNSQTNGNQSIVNKNGSIVLGAGSRTTKAGASIAEERVANSQSTIDANSLWWLGPGIAIASLAISSDDSHARSSSDSSAESNTCQSSYSSSESSTDYSSDCSSSSDSSSDYSSDSYD